MINNKDFSISDGLADFSKVSVLEDGYPKKLYLKDEEVPCKNNEGSNGTLVGPPGPQGKQGVPGRDGKDGSPGKDGKNGEPGIQGIEGPQGISGRDGTSFAITKIFKSTDEMVAAGDILDGSMVAVLDSSNNAYVYLAMSGYIPSESQDISGFKYVLNLIEATIITGPEGPQGIQGIPGPQGQPGPAGSDGRDGLPGRDGAQGIEGPQGAAGFSPTIGLNGNWFVGGIDTKIHAGDVTASDELIWGYTQLLNVQCASGDIVPIKQITSNKISTNDDGTICLPKGVYLVSLIGTISKNNSIAGIFSISLYNTTTNSENLSTRMASTNYNNSYQSGSAEPSIIIKSNGTDKFAIKSNNSCLYEYIYLAIVEIGRERIIGIDKTELLYAGCSVDDSNLTDIVKNQNIYFNNCNSNSTIKNNDGSIHLPKGVYSINLPYRLSTSNPAAASVVLKLFDLDTNTVIEDVSWSAASENIDITGSCSSPTAILKLDKVTNVCVRVIDIGRASKISLYQMTMYITEVGRAAVIDNPTLQGPAGQDGPPGEAGISPNVGVNGNWFIDGTDTGVYAGHIPTSEDLNYADLKIVNNTFNITNTGDVIHFDPDISKSNMIINTNGNLVIKPGKYMLGLNCRITSSDNVERRVDLRFYNKTDDMLFGETCYRITPMTEIGASCSDCIFIYEFTKDTEICIKGFSSTLPVIISDVHSFITEIGRERFIDNTVDNLRYGTFVSAKESPYITPVKAGNIIKFHESAVTNMNLQDGYVHFEPGIYNISINGRIVGKSGTVNGRVVDCYLYNIDSNTDYIDSTGDKVHVQFHNVKATTTEYGPYIYNKIINITQPMNLGIRINSISDGNNVTSELQYLGLNVFEVGKVQTITTKGGITEIPISAEPDNAIEMKDDGLYSPRVESAGAVMRTAPLYYSTFKHKNMSIVNPNKPYITFDTTEGNIPITSRSTFMLEPGTYHFKYLPNLSAGNTIATFLQYAFVDMTTGINISTGNNGAVYSTNYNATKSSPTELSYIMTIDTQIEIGIKVTNSNPGTCLVGNGTGFIAEVARAVDPVQYLNEESGLEDTPVGHILSHMGTIAPKHYLICDGSVYNAADYPHLVAHILKDFGRYDYFGGNGSTTFAVPDLRNGFVSGYYGYPSEQIPDSNTANNIDTGIGEKYQHTGFTATTKSNTVLYCIKCEPTYFANFSNLIESGYELELITDKSMNKVGDYILPKSIDDYDFIQVWAYMYNLGGQTNQKVQIIIPKEEYYRKKSSYTNNIEDSFGLMGLDTGVQNLSRRIYFILSSPTKLSIALVDGNSSPTITAIYGFKQKRPEKFNIYNQEEKICGTWVDGNPIYRKVIMYDRAIDVGGRLSIADLTSSNIGDIVKLDTMAFNTTDAFCVTYTNGNDRIALWYNRTLSQLYIHTAVALSKINVVIEYTKK